MADANASWRIRLRGRSGGVGGHGTRVAEARPKAERRVGLPRSGRRGRRQWCQSHEPKRTLSFGHAARIGHQSAGTKAPSSSGLTTPTLSETLDARGVRDDSRGNSLIARATDRVVIASDRIDVYHEHATTMIERGFGYVCTCSAEAFRESIWSDRVPCRSVPVPEHTARWEGCSKVPLRMRSFA